MTAVSGFDHIALAVPDIDAQVERFTSGMGMVVQSRSETFALVEDPVSGIKFELTRSTDGEAHVRHLGFRADEVDSAHQELVDAGMLSSEAPHRRDFARMYTSFLREDNDLEIQLVKYD